MGVQRLSPFPDTMTGHLVGERGRARSGRSGGAKKASGLSGRPAIMISFEREKGWMH